MDVLLFEQFGAPLWLWLLFVALLVSLLSFDLGVLNKRDHEIGVRESLLLSTLYIGLGLAFGAVLWWRLGPETGLAYLTGFIVEKSLSLDNIFVISMIFLRFSIPRAYRHRVLFWGVLFAIALRAVMIGFGAVLIAQFSWTLYIFSAVLIVTGARTLIHPGERAPEAENALVRFVRAKFNVTDRLYGKRFFVRLLDPATNETALFATPLFLALVSIELADLVFAVDSVPAIFAITTDPFVVYTSNIFAILGLRALFFALSAVMERFRYLEPTLAIVLIFIGSKIFVADLTGEHIPPWVSLAGSLGIIAAGGLYSLWRSKPGAAKWISRAAATACATAAVFALGWFAWPRRDETPRYVTQPVGRGAVTRAVTTAGVIEPRTPRRIEAAVSGRIATTHCEHGARVEAGQICARIDDGPYRLRVERERTALARAQARLEESKARLADASAALQRSRNAEKVAPSALDKADRARDRAHARAMRDEAEVARRREALIAAEAVLARTEIASPVAGVIVSRRAETGRIVGGAGDPPLFVVAPDVATVEARAPAAEIAEIEIGDRAFILPDARPGEPLGGEVSLVQRGRRAQGRSEGRVTVSAPDPDRILADGAKASIAIEVDRREDVLRAPKRAIDYSTGRQQAEERDAPPPGWTHLWVMRDGRPTPVAVRLGANDGAYAEVVEGDLRPDDRLILGEEARAAQHAPNVASAIGPDSDGDVR